MRARTLSTASIAILAVASACVSRPGGGVGTTTDPKANGSSSRTRGSRGTNEGIARKIVTGKEEPNRLIARDGTVCTVSRKKFESAILGKSTRCGWVDQKR